MNIFEEVKTSLNINLHDTKLKHAAPAGCNTQCRGKVNNMSLQLLPLLEQAVKNLGEAQVPKGVMGLPGNFQKICKIR